MLVITRKIEQSLTIEVGDETITVAIFGVDRERVKIGVQANPERVRILRTELLNSPA